jgi:hypothetical protein
LSKIGYQFNGDELDDFQAQAFLLVASAYNKEQKREMNKKPSKGRRS